MANMTLNCTAATFATPTILGAEILAIHANLVTNYSANVSDQYYYNHPSSVLEGVDFCNVTVSYTHPGQEDAINVETWLPLHNNWNSRLQAVRGGGYIPSRFFLSYAAMVGALGEGYAASSSDAGLWPSPYLPDSWAQISPGNVDLYKLQNFGSVALRDQVRFPIPKTSAAKCQVS